MSNVHVYSASNNAKSATELATEFTIGPTVSRVLDMGISPLLARLFHNLNN